jgi:integrase
MPKPERRENSDGTTTWRVRYRLDGKQIPRTFYAEAPAQKFCDWITAFGLGRALELLEHEMERVTASTAPTMTLNEWAERYISSLTGASSGTKAGYRSTFKHSFGHYLGTVRLDQLNREMIAGTIAKLMEAGGRRGDGYSDKSIANQHGLLSAMLDTAVRDRHIETSPSEHVSLPRRTEHQDTQRRFFVEEEFWDLWDTMVVHYRPLLESLVGTGHRWGEGEALLVGDLNVRKSVLRINKAAKNDGAGKRIVGPTKTRKSNRVVSIDDQLLETYERIAHGRDPGERLFLAPRGGVLHHKVFWQDAWVPACRRLGWNPHPRIHDLRHTHASWLIAEGVSMKVIQERLGHESLKTTMDLYGHLLPGAQLEAAEAMGKVWGRRGRPQLQLVDDAS